MAFRSVSKKEEENKRAEQKREARVRAKCECRALRLLQASGLACRSLSFRFQCQVHIHSGNLLDGLLLPTEAASPTTPDSREMHPLGNVSSKRALQLVSQQLDTRIGVLSSPAKVL